MTPENSRYLAWGKLRVLGKCGGQRGKNSARKRKELRKRGCIGGKQTTKC